MKTKRLFWVLLALLIVSSLVLSACGGQTEETPEVVVEVETGEPAGWDYDVWNAICELLNCTPVFVEAAWEGMIQAVADGQFDAAGDGITITDERDEIVDFSVGYVAIEQRLLVRIDEDRFEDIEGIVADESLKLGTQTGTTNYETAATYLPEDRISAFEQFPFAVQALIAGDIDAVMIDEVAGLGYQGENADALKLSGPSMSSDVLGFIFPNGSELVELVNGAIAELAQNGFLGEVNQEYFGPEFNITYDDLFPPEPITIGTEDHPIKVLFVPSVDVDFMIAGGELIEQALFEATGMYVEVSVPTSYAATIEEMCASPTDTVGFIPAMGYALANQLCGVTPGLASERYGWNVYWTAFFVARDSDFQTLTDLEGASWAYPDATSTSGFLYPQSLYADLGITVGETIEAGGHPQAVKAVYNGEADFGTAYFSAPLLPEGTWSVDMAPDIPDELVPDCGVTEEGRLYCGDWRVLDARAAIREEAPDVVQKVRILDISPEIPNDTMSFSPDFPDALKELVIQAVTAYVASDACSATLCNESFYDWTGVGPIFDENFDGIRIMMEAQGISLENIGE